MDAGPSHSRRVVFACLLAECSSPHWVWWLDRCIISLSSLDVVHLLCAFPFPTLLDESTSIMLSKGFPTCQQVLPGFL